MCRCNYAFNGRVPLSTKRYNEISFNFTNGFSADYQKWLEGYRIKVTGNDVTWIKEVHMMTVIQVLENIWI